MRQKLKVLLIGSVICFLFVVSCKNGKLKVTESKDALAVINGEGVTLQEFEGMGRRFSRDYDLSKEEDKKKLLQKVIDNKLLIQEAQRQGLEEDEVIISQVSDYKEDIWATFVLRREMRDKVLISNEEIEAELVSIKKVGNDQGAVPSDLEEEKERVECRLRNERERIQFEKFREELLTKAKVMKYEENLKGGEDASPSLVVAMVEDHEITLGNLKEQLPATSMLSRISKDEYITLLGKLLDQKILNILLYQRALSVRYDQTEEINEEIERFKNELLLNKLITDTVFADSYVTDQEIEEYYKTHKKEDTADLTEVKGEIERILLKSKKAEQFQAFMADLQDKAKVSINEELFSKIK